MLANIWHILRFSIRPINLLIVALTQWLTLTHLIHTNLAKEGLTPDLQGNDMWLFIATTLFIAAGGYLINDLVDQKGDLINKPYKKLVSPSVLNLAYWILTSMGFLSAYVVAVSVDKVSLLWIYPLAVFFLHYYSTKLKNKGFLGNIMVAFMCACVSAIFILAEPQLIGSISVRLRLIANVLILFSVFAFFINLIREIVKDLEDMEGDKVAGSKSLPLVVGVKRTKIVCHFNTIALIIVLLVWSYYTYDATQNIRIILYNLIFVIAPLSRGMLKLGQAQSNREYKQVATLLKWIMISGLFSLLVTIQSIP